MENITISMEEYKELLMIKGKYEELKSQQTLKPTYTVTQGTKIIVKTIDTIYSNKRIFLKEEA